MNAARVAITAVDVGGGGMGDGNGGGFALQEVVLGLVAFLALHFLRTTHVDIDLRGRIDQGCVQITMLYMVAPASIEMAGAARGP
jgi:hypothetical protein